MAIFLKKGDRGEEESICCDIKNLLLYVINNVTITCASYFSCSPMNRGCFYIEKCRSLPFVFENHCTSIFYIRYLYRAFRFITSFYSLDSCSFQKVVVFIIITVTTPFEIFDSIIGLYLILMVYTWVLFCVGKKRLGNNRMNMLVGFNPFSGKCHPHVPICAKSGIKESFWVMLDIFLFSSYCSTNSSVRKSFYSPNVRDFVKSLVAFYGFPNLFHCITM